MKEFSEETRKRMSESAKKRCADPEWIAMQKARGTQLPINEVVEMYNSGMTQEEIGKHFCVSQKCIWKFMKRHNIRARKAAKRDQYRENNSSWRGGIVEGPNGYKLQKCVGHPRAKKCGDYVFQHIIVAEEMIGRRLMPDEVVHHINGNKADNRPENLRVMTRSEHIKLHWAMRRCGTS